MGELQNAVIFDKVLESTQGDRLMQNMFMVSLRKYLLEQRYNHNRQTLQLNKLLLDYFPKNDDVGVFTPYMVGLILSLVISFTSIAFCEYSSINFLSLHFVPNVTRLS